MSWSRNAGVDFDICDRRSLDTVVVQAVPTSWEMYCYSISTSEKYLKFQTSPFLSVSVDVSVLTAATSPLTTVSGGLRSVTKTDIPIRELAMFAASFSLEHAIPDGSEVLLER